MLEIIIRLGSTKGSSRICTSKFATLKDHFPQVTVQIHNLNTLFKFNQFCIFHLFFHWHFLQQTISSVDHKIPKLSKTFTKIATFPMISRPENTHLSPSQFSQTFKADTNPARCLSPGPSTHTQVQPTSSTCDPHTGFPNRQQTAPDPPSWARWWAQRSACCRSSSPHPPRQSCHQRQRPVPEQSQVRSQGTLSPTRPQSAFWWLCSSLAAFFTTHNPLQGTRPLETRDARDLLSLFSAFYEGSTPGVCCWALFLTCMQTLMSVTAQWGCTNTIRHQNKT